MHITTQCSLNSSHGNHEKPPDVLLSYNIWIPLDLTREILLRLPSKSLAKFRCVSKQWLSITTQPDFMKSFIAPWPYNCPYAGSECSVMGDIPFLVAHLRDDHKVDMNSSSSFTHRYVKSNPLEVENVTWMLCVFHCFGQYFCLHFEAFQLEMAPVYMAFLHFMGDETEARNYNYSLEVGGYDQKLTWEGTPRSVRDSHRKVRDSHDGLIIQRDMALFFSGRGFVLLR